MSTNAKVGDYVRFKILSGEVSLRVEAATTTMLTLSTYRDTTDASLVAEGFTVKEIYVPGSHVTDYEPSTSYEHRLVVARTDPRLIP